MEGLSMDLTQICDSISTLDDSLCEGTVKRECAKCRRNDNQSWEEGGYVQVTVQRTTGVTILSQSSHCKNRSDSIVPWNPQALCSPLSPLWEDAVLLKSRETMVFQIDGSQNFEKSALEIPFEGLFRNIHARFLIDEKLLGSWADGYLKFTFPFEYWISCTYLLVLLWIDIEMFLFCFC